MFFLIIALAIMFSFVSFAGFEILCGLSFIKCYSSEHFVFTDALTAILLITPRLMLIGGLIVGGLFVVRSLFSGKIWVYNIYINIIIGVSIGAIEISIIAIFIGGGLDYFPVIGYIPFAFAGALIGGIVARVSPTKR